MALQKVIYTDNQTVIGAKNLNDIQDAIIDLENSGGGTIDTSLSTTSTNAVQNKVVTAALNDKQGILTAGNGIKIENNIISVTYEDGNEVSY